MYTLIDLKNKVLAGDAISPQEAAYLSEQDLDALCSAANDIRSCFCGNAFDICTIINAKSGRCSEDCKYCAQSAHYQTTCAEYPLLDTSEVMSDAMHKAQRGVLRYSLVTSGRNISDDELIQICDMAQQLKRVTPMQLCGSFGLLHRSQYQKLYDAGLRCMHNNLETSAHYFPQMCSTHSFGDKLAAIEQAKDTGMAICSGGIFGLGENMHDRISLAFSLKDFQIKSVPLNLLSPIEGTPYQGNTPLCPDEFRCIIALYRFILPDAFLRLAGGRGLLPDKGRSCFLSGANAVITGDMLTTAGISIETDLQMIQSLGFSLC